MINRFERMIVKSERVKINKSERMKMNKSETVIFNKYGRMMNEQNFKLSLGRFQQSQSQSARKEMHLTR